MRQLLQLMSAVANFCLHQAALALQYADVEGAHIVQLPHSWLPSVSKEGHNPVQSCGNMLTTLPTAGVAGFCSHLHTLSFVPISMADCCIFGLRVCGKEANQTVLVDINGATKMTMMVNGGQEKCTARAPSGGHLVNGMMENGLKGKKMGWVCSPGVMAPHMMAFGSLGRSTALGYAVHPVYRGNATLRQQC